MENNGAAAAVPEKEAVTAPASSCFKRTVGEDARWVDLAKDQYRQFTEAPVTEHWACIKNKVSSMLAEPIFGRFKDESSSSAPPSVESQ
ncbi:hypothetical protein D1007_09379 [Hordeum vulgare]|uniref:Uncharacterized protein n=1 Tax=Hordeum vulgare subsp. vulgare TaxID=112509 RepID=A0A8I7B3S7_HORVV|nr:hypothetical protein D1007_09379 [Hordeum vulgare]